MSKHDDYLDPDKHLYPPDPPVDMDEVMPSHYSQIKEFMQAFGQETPDLPCIPSLAVRRLRAKTILEEALERIQALGFATMYRHDGRDYPDTFTELDFDVIQFDELYEFSATDFLDGVCDGEYFDLGSLIALGISESKYMEHFEKVHRANMGKLWNWDEVYDAYGNLDPYQLQPDGSYLINKISDDRNVIYNKVKKIGDKYLVKDQDGKVIKPKSFVAPETIV